MAKCAICEKGAHFGIAVSHSHRRTNKKWLMLMEQLRRCTFVLHAYVLD